MVNFVLMLILSCIVLVFFFEKSFFFLKDFGILEIFSIFFRILGVLYCIASGAKLGFAFVFQFSVMIV